MSNSFLFIYISLIVIILVFLRKFFYSILDFLRDLFK